MPHECADDNQNERDQKDENGDAVHAMHQENVDIARLIRVPFLQKEILLDLIPDTAFIPLVRLPLHIRKVQ